MLEEYINEQINKIGYRLDAYVLDDEQRRNPKRHAYLTLDRYIKRFLGGDSSIRLVLMPGFRGTGKTTILAQLYDSIKLNKNINKLFLTVDHITKLMQSSLHNALLTYEGILGQNFEESSLPTILFLDEIQFDENWVATLKSIYDRTKKVMIIATGSSALSLQNSPDLARRAVIEKIFPMTFCEYMKIKDRKFEIKGLTKDLKEIIFNSTDSKELYERLTTLINKIDEYWLNISDVEIMKYINYGSLPFTIQYKNESIIYDQINKTVDKIVREDIQTLGEFEPFILQKIPSILYSMANSDILVQDNLARDLGINRKTLVKILDILEMTEMVVKILPYGSNPVQVRKPSKYLFSSPAFRAMFFNFVGSINTLEDAKGKLLEDTFTIYFSKLFSRLNNISLTYDPSKNSADFILKINNRTMIFEVGFNKDSNIQVINSMKKTRSKIGIKITNKELYFDEETKVVTIPLKYFLLI